MSRARRKTGEVGQARAELVGRVLMAGREQSTAAVMFHTAMAAKQGLGASDGKALDLIDRFGPLTAGELGERAGLAPASITGLVDRLEQKGLARRIKDPADGRRVLVELDRAALGRHAHLFTDLVREMQELAAEFTDDELEVILRFLGGATRRQQAATARLSGLAPQGEPTPTPPRTRSRRDR